MSRLLFWWRILARPAWYWMVVAPVFALSAFTLIRDEFLNEKWQARLQITEWSLWPSWWAWIIIALVIAILIILESAYRIHQNQQLAPTTEDAVGSRAASGIFAIQPLNEPMFNMSGVQGFPRDPPDTFWMGLEVGISAVPNAHIDTVQVDLSAHRLHSTWEARLVTIQDRRIVYFKIPNSVAGGIQLATLVALDADGKDYEPSPPFNIDFPTPI